MIRQYISILTLIIAYLGNCISLNATNEKPNTLELYFSSYPRSIDSLNISFLHPAETLSLSEYHTIKVHNQEEFDDINSLIAQALFQGIKDIRISLEVGFYEYQENHIKLSNLESNFNLFIDGNGSSIISKSLPLNKTKSPYYIYSKNTTPIEQWSDTFQTEEAILPTDDNEIYKLKLIPEANVEVGDLIKISQWYLSSIYEICKIDDEYMYFSSEYPCSLNRHNWDETWNMNHDVRYGNVMPRFRVFKPSYIDNLKEHKATCFINIKDTEFNSLIISNLNIWGSAYHKKTGVINLVNTLSKSTVIDSCEFHDCKSPCISLRGSKNVLIKECTFTDNYNTCIETYDQCIYTSIANNYFKDNGRDWYNYFDIIISGENFLVADNTLVNFTYGAIRVGNWWGSPKKGSVTGIVENNLIFYTPDFYANYQKHTLMDSGAIYVNTINDEVHIRYNRIFNIAGMKNYRGIFGDDGTCNCNIYGNIISGIKDSNCIDLRYVPIVEEKEAYSFGQVNVGNILMLNIVDGNIRFEGRIGKNKSQKGMNFFLRHRSQKKNPMLYIKNIANEKDDSIILLKKLNNELIFLSRKDKNTLKKLSFYDRIKKWIK